MQNENHLLQQLPYLQDRIKRDKAGYRNEFDAQYVRFLSLLKIMETEPSANNKGFADLTNFLSHVVTMYDDKCEEFVSLVHDFVEKHHAVMNRVVRTTLVSCLILLRNKQAIQAVKLLKLCFLLFRCADKALRLNMHKYIVNDVRNINRQSTNQQLNKTLQSFLFSMINDTSPVAAKKSVDVMAELYRRKVWNDARTANVMAEACFSPHSKVRATALSFFIGNDEEDPDAVVNSDEEIDEPSRRDVYNAMHRTVSKSKKKEKKIKRALKKVKNKGNRKIEDSASYSALHFIHDPHAFSEKLLSALRKSTDGFQAKLQIMHVISRVMSIHQLQVLGFHPFVQRYLKPSQPEITQILAYIAQATHPLLPPDVVQPILVTLVNEFVSDRSSSEAQAVGLNTIRELCQRCPSIMNETLLQDLVQYKNERDKSVSIAARSLIHLFRKLNPKMLHKRDRGKEGADGAASALEFGQTEVSTGVEGVELLGDRLSDGEDKWSESSGDSDGEEIQIDEDGSGQEGSGDEGSGSEDEDGEEISLDGEEISLDGDEIEFEEWSGDGSDDDGDGDGDGGDTKSTKSTKSTQKGDTESVVSGSVASSSRLDTLKILSPADFKRLKALKTAKEVEKLVGSSKKRKLQDEILEKDPTEVNDKVEISDIVGIQKKYKATKEERLAKVMEGREGRQKFGHKQQKTGNAGLTNKEKEKRKVSAMVRRSVVRKKHNKPSRKTKDKQFRGKFRK
eukprot:c4465_g1_i1.p1 GENE.c4465_g1_i1~~c4465_g1_i1.p1  ORF type:complete len:734 (-),score=187.12 c4465_g1_i1:19-2220(-)